jgi:hypothetical protein
VAASADSGRAERLLLDPARLEECLMLVDLGSPGAVPGEPPSSVQVSGDVEFPESLVALGERARAALLHARLEEVPGLLAAEAEVWRGLGPPPSPRLTELERLVSRHSGAARACGPGPANLAFVWAAPGARGRGPREEVVRALAGGGFRVYPCRVDLRGLEVDDA